VNGTDPEQPPGVPEPATPHLEKDDMRGWRRKGEEGGGGRKGGGR